MRKTIRPRLLAVIVGLTVVVLVLVGVVVAWQSYTAQRQQALDLQHEISVRAAAEAASFVNGLEEELRLAAKLLDLTGLDSEGQYVVLSRLHSYGDEFEELVLLDSRGREQMRISRLEAFTAADLGDRYGAPEFLMPTTTGETYYTPVSFDPLTGEPSITVAVPLINLRSSLPEGVLVADIRLKKFGI